MKRNKAFALGEVIVVFIIIGIIASIAMSIIRPFEKAYKYSYTKIFSALSAAIYNHMTTVAGVDAFPENPTKFCNALVSFINTSNNAQHSGDNPCNLSGDKDDFLGNEPTLEDFAGENAKNPKIRLSNGAWLWIGADKNEEDELVPFTYTQTINATTNDTVKYYIVYADLNGDRGPNKIANTDTISKGHLPDIVAFAVTDSFAVIPLGYPKVDQRYLSAHIVYPATEEDDTSDEKEHYSDSMTYYEAIVGAYGKSQNKIVTYGIAETYDLESSLPNANPFKLTGSNLDSFYVNPPVFNQQICGDGSAIAQIIANNRDSYCDIKVFNYN